MMQVSQIWPFLLPTSQMLPEAFNIPSKYLYTTLQLYETNANLT